MPLMEMEGTEHAKDDTLKRIGDISGIVVFSNQVLVAIYQRPERTKSGILLPEQTRGEDNYIGKVGLVLKMGPQAFVEDEKTRFPNKAEVGDWVIFRTADTWAFDYNSKEGHCRMIDDIDIRATVQQPDMVW